MTKAKFQKTIKAMGNTTFDGVTTATIAGYKVGMEKSIIIVEVGGIDYKFPTFTEVEASESSVDFLTKNRNRSNCYFKGDNKVADAYIEVVKTVLV